MIKIEDLDFRYEDETDPEKYALRHLSMSVREGEFIAIIGENGSGKSTLAKLINAVYSPTSGRVLVAGMDTQDPKHLWNIRSIAGMVFQNPDNQMVATIVEEDVAFGPENLGIPQPEIVKRVAQALETVGMQGFAGRTPSSLSGGQKQRVAIAGVLAMQPRCVVFDESTAMLDPSGRKEVLESIDILIKRGITVMLVTHYMDEATGADRIVVVEDGRVIMQGTPREIFANTEKLRQSSLDIPQITEVAEALGGMGVCLSIDEFMKRLPQADCSNLGVIKLPEKRMKVSTDENIIEIENLDFSYDPGAETDKRILKNINLNIKRGELIGLIGHTGSGKSTLVQHLNGLLLATGGDVRVGGVSLSSHLEVGGKKPTKAEIKEGKKRLLEIRKRVGLVFQYPEYQLFEETVEKDIAFGPKNLGYDDEKIKQLVIESMEDVGLDYEKFKDRSPFDLSGGQKRRVAIAGVLAMQPEVLILDEPTAGLDPKGRDEILGEVLELHQKRRRTIIIVSHSMEDMARIAERIIVMNQGEIAMDGPPREIYQNVEALESMGLDLPYVTKLLERLSQEGYPVDTGLLNVESAAIEIASVLQQRAGGMPCCTENAGNAASTGGAHSTGAGGAGGEL